jgi:SAM-dependent methyltransferase
MTDNPRDQYRDPSRLNARMTLHERFSTNELGWHPWVFSHLALRAGEAVLEVGCGTGELWVTGAKRVLARSITLSDLSPGMARAARDRLKSRGLEAQSCVANVEALPFPDGAFDAVAANHMMYHVADIPLAVRELRRVLRKGGRLLCATNGKRHMQQFGKLLKAVAPKWPGFTYIDRFGLENGEAYLSAQFQNIEVRSYPDALEITDASAGADYAVSMQTIRELDAEPADSRRGGRRDQEGRPLPRRQGRRPLHLPLTHSPARFALGPPPPQAAQAGKSRKSEERHLKWSQNRPLWLILGGGPGGSEETKG